MIVAVCARNDAAEAERVAATLLASRERPDAIAAMSDEQAAGVVRAARAAGRAIPGDVAVTGWDDAAVAAELGLTTVRQSLREQGAACAHAALGETPARRPRRGPSSGGAAPAPRSACARGHEAGLQVRVRDRGR